MKKVYVYIKASLLVVSLSSPVFGGVTLGDPNSELGALIVSGAIRANYQNKTYDEPSSDRKIKFDTAILNVAYESLDWFGKLQYRCYQYDTLCDFSTLVEAYGGYNLNETDKLTFGLQAIPFGPGRYWDSSFYAGLNNTMGLQDALNVGINYHFETPSATKIDLAYFVMDGGHYHGDSKDAARYTSNLVSSLDSLNTDLNEKNMFMVRVDQELEFLSSDDLKVSIGGSYWHSEIENKKTAINGSCNSWAVFNRVNYEDLSILMTGGKQSIINKDELSPHHSTFGSLDGEYQIANKGYFYKVDMSYSFKNLINEINIVPYIVFSGFNKDHQDFENSYRNILGISFAYKNASLYTEYVTSKNDNFGGGNSQSLAAGDDGKENKLLNLIFLYSF